MMLTSLNSCFMLTIFLFKHETTTNMTKPTQTFTVTLLYVLLLEERTWIM